MEFNFKNNNYLFFKRAIYLCNKNGLTSVIDLNAVGNINSKMNRFFMRILFP